MQETEGDNLNHTAEEDSVRPTFKTNAGRLVYGGGGITPDFIVKSQDVTEYTTDLLKNNLIYLFTLHYLDIYGSEIKVKYKNLNSFRKEFKFPEDKVDEFIKYASDKGVKLNEEDFNQDKEYIITRIKAYIARNYWKNEGWYSVLLGIDSQVNKAAGLFNEARDLAGLK
jgi:carboxyl-terminal processing protease